MSDSSISSLPPRDLRTEFGSRGSLLPTTPLVDEGPMPESRRSRDILGHFIDCRVPYISHDRIKREGFLGEGAYMTVDGGFLTAPDKPPIPIAIKRIVRSSLPLKGDPQIRTLISRYRSAIRSILLEVDITSHEQLSVHRNIIRLLGFTLSVSEDHVNEFGKQVLLPELIVERAICDLGEYYERNSHLHSDTPPITLAIRFIADIADGISAIHAYGVMHADLKPENILLFPDEHTGLVAKLADFGVRGLELQSQAPGFGTKRWAAPEPPIQSFDVNGFHYRSDIYAFGLLVGYLALDGVFPLPEPEFAPQSSQTSEYVDLHTLKADPNDRALRLAASRIAHRLKEFTALSIVITTVLSQTLLSRPEDRVGSLSHIRHELDPYTGDRPRPLPNQIQPFNIRPFRPGHAEERKYTPSSKFYNLRGQLPAEVLRALLDDGEDGSLYGDTLSQMNDNSSLIGLINAHDDLEAWYRRMAWSFQTLGPDMSGNWTPSSAELKREWHNGLPRDDILRYCIIEDVPIPEMEIAMSAGPNPEEGIVWPTYNHGLTPLHVAARCGRVDYIRYLHQHYDVNAKATSCHWTPLHFATHLNQIDAINVLVDLGADINAKIYHPGIANSHKAYSRVTPVCLALLGSSIQTLECLLTLGASLEPRHLGQTCIHTAVAKGDVQALLAILRVGHQAKHYIDCPDSFGHSALTIAVAKGDLCMVRLLLEEGANPNIRALNGCTPYSYSLYFHSTTLESYNSIHPGRISMDRNHDRELIPELLLQHGAVLQSFLASGPTSNPSGWEAKEMIKAAMRNDWNLTKANEELESRREARLDANYEGLRLDGVPRSSIILTHRNAHQFGTELEVAIIAAEEGHHLWKSGGCCVFPPHDQSVSITFLLPPLLPERYRITARIARLKCPWNNFRFKLSIVRVVDLDPVRYMFLGEFSANALCPQEDLMYEVCLGEFVATEQPSDYLNGNLNLMILSDVRSGGLLIDWIRISKPEGRFSFSYPVDISDFSRSQLYLRHNDLFANQGAADSKSESSSETNAKNFDQFPDFLNHPTLKPFNILPLSSPPTASVAQVLSPKSSPPLKKAASLLKAAVVDGCSAEEWQEWFTGTFIQCISCDDIFTQRKFKEHKRVCAA